MLAAMDLAADHDLSIWDAVILAAAADAGCRLLLSEDMQDGFAWRGLTVANPFADRRHPLLTAILNEAPNKSSYLPRMGGLRRLSGVKRPSPAAAGDGRRAGCRIVPGRGRSRVSVAPAGKPR